MNESVAARAGRSCGVVRQFVRLTLATSTLLAAGLPVAHSAEEGSPVQEVTITGSRIRQQTGMTTPVPVTSLSTSDLAALNPGASIADQL